MRARPPWSAAWCPTPTFDDRLAGLLLAQRHMHARGITAWQDAIVGDYLGSPDPLPVYLAAAAAGQLTARVQGALWWDRDRGIEQLPDILARRERGQAGRFRANTVKIMQDGVAENFTAGMIEPYLDSCGCQTSNSGLSYVDPQQLQAAAARLDAEGFQVHLHAIGDRAVRESLDAIGAARAANGPSDNRHHIAHLQVIHPDDIPRFAQLDVTANMQALWAAHEPQLDELTIPFIGPDRTQRELPVRRSAAGGRAAGRRQRLGGQQRKSAACLPRRGEPVAARCRRPRGRAVPAGPAPRARRGARCLYRRLGPREPPR